MAVVRTGDFSNSSTAMWRPVLKLRDGICPGSERMTNYKIISGIRSELAKELSIEKVQQILFDYWSPYIRDKHSVTIDAICYGSELRYPTDEKLLWESVAWSYRQMKGVCKELGVCLPQTTWGRYAQKQPNTVARTGKYLYRGTKGKKFH